MTAERVPDLAERVAIAEMKIERICEVIGDVLAREIRPGVEMDAAPSIAEIRGQLGVLLARNARIVRSYGLLCAEEGRHMEAAQMRRLADAMTAEIPAPPRPARHLRVVE